MEPQWDQHPYSPQEKPKKSVVGRYIISFIWMIFFTAISFLLVGKQWFNADVTFSLILSLAIAQVIIQLFTFMHLDMKRYRIILIFLCVGVVIATISAVGIVVM